ncbi:MAG: redox-regulated ATPase YchF [Candidatus Melainabacteria bacterium]|jgi:ribosome-binding ATPase|nr:redox-regulated ATPase YchF [Candidatus Melainabacteria bacterium]
MLKSGIVGLPNVGKSTLFNALSNNHIAEAANYPFCTIEPNSAIVNVPDSRLQVLQKFVSTDVVVPAVIEFMDIAGLVKGASQGEGLGNKFLSNIRECDLIVHVVRCFDDENVIHVDGKVDPLSDIETINTELILSDLEQVQKSMDKLIKKVRGQDKEAKVMFDALEKILPVLEEGKAARTVDLDEEEKLAIKSYGLLTLKEIVYAANIPEADMAAGTNDYVAKLEAYAKTENAGVVVISAAAEEQLVGMTDNEKKEFLEELGVHETGLSKLIQRSYELLGLRTYFTAGVKEVRAWTIHVGDKAPQAAGVIHGDFEKGFIKAETIGYDDFVAIGSRPKARELGKARQEGKEYVVQDGDVIEFKFNN